jgi:hypothetical protein
VLLERRPVLGGQALREVVLDEVVLGGLEAREQVGLGEEARLDRLRRSLGELTEQEPAQLVRCHGARRTHAYSLMSRQAVP